jgi:hypothetical protein
MLPGQNDQSISRQVILAGFMVAAGLCLTPCGILALGPVVAIIGILLILGALLVWGLAVGQGLSSNKKASTTTTILAIGESKIIARFGVNHLGETIFQEEYLDFDDPSTRLFVKLAEPDGRRYELRTNEHVWRNCGEGMRGAAQVQGDWLASFTPHMGQGVGNPYREG